MHPQVLKIQSILQLLSQSNQAFERLEQELGFRLNKGQLHYEILDGLWILLKGITEHCQHTPNKAPYLALLLNFNRFIENPGGRGDEQFERYYALACQLRKYLPEHRSLHGCICDYRYLNPYRNLLLRPFSLPEAERRFIYENPRVYQIPIQGILRNPTRFLQILNQHLVRFRREAEVQKAKELEDDKGKHLAVSWVEQQAQVLDIGLLDRLFRFKALAVDSNCWPRFVDFLADPSQEEAFKQLRIELSSSSNWSEFFGDIANVRSLSPDIAPWMHRLLTVDDDLERQRLINLYYEDEPLPALPVKINDAEENDFPLDLELLCQLASLREEAQQNHCIAIICLFQGFVLNPSELQYQALVKKIGEKPKTQNLFQPFRHALETFYRLNAEEQKSLRDILMAKDPNAATESLYDDPANQSPPPIVFSPPPADLLQSPITTQTNHLCKP